MFGATQREHVNNMLFWLRLGAECYRPDPKHRPDFCEGVRPYPRSHRDDYEYPPLQTEFFLQELLDGAGVRVEKVPFHRTDLRVYDVKGTLTPCVPSLYWRCMNCGEIGPNCRHSSGLMECQRLIDRADHPEELEREEEEEMAAMGYQ